MKSPRLVGLATIIIAIFVSVLPVLAQTPTFTEFRFMSKTIGWEDEVDYAIKFVSPQASGLPVIRIDTKDGAPILDKENYVNMTFALTDIDNPSNNITVVNNTDGIRGRGNSTWSYDKKPYRIKFDKKQSLFGLPAAKSWVLLAEYLDATLILNTTAFELGNVLHLPYNHTYHHVQLYLNGVYRGVYGLTEQNQVGNGRVDIDENDGWLVEFDSYYDEEPQFRTTNYNLPVMIKSPEVEPELISNSAYDFVRKDINELCDSMASTGFPENGYRDLIDMNTFVDFLMVNEIVFNNELSWPKSTFSYKDNGGKISMGPLWDFDWAFCDPRDVGYIIRFLIYEGRSGKHNFFNRFFEDPVFLVKYKERWNEKYTQILAVSAFIDSVGTELEEAAADNFKVWDAYDPLRNVTYPQQITNMKEWWNNRCVWLNSELNKIDVLPNNKTFTTQVFGYTETAQQTFTFVSYGDMTDLSAMFQKGESSGFEISAELNKTATGNGGYLATISVKPKIGLSAAVYTDTLILSGVNQGNLFSHEVPLRLSIGTVSVLTPNHVIPAAKPDETAMVIAPVTILPDEFTAGPNPISKQSGIVNFYRQGRRIAACELRIYDVTGNIINKIKINDKALNSQARRKVGMWDLTDRKGRPVSEGTYLVKGVLKTSDGKVERVSLILGVR